MRSFNLLARRGIASSVAGTLLSCASLPITRLQPTDEPWTNYVIGRVQSAPTGSTMVEWIGRGSFLHGFVMVAAIQARIKRPLPSDAGVWAARYAYHGPCDQGRYLITNRAFYGGEIGIIVTEDGTIPCEASMLQIRGAKRGREFLTPDAVGVRAFAPAPFLDDQRATPIKWELIYSGRSGDEISITYREYIAGPRGTFARPAFYQELRYDLATSDRVVFRSVEVEILEASNAGVEFRVLRDAERTWLEPPTTDLAPRAVEEAVPAD